MAWTVDFVGENAKCGEAGYAEFESGEEETRRNFGWLRRDRLRAGREKLRGTQRARGLGRMRKLGTLLSLHTTLYHKGQQFSRVFCEYTIRIE
jgi:hypothetical protein